MPKGCILTLDRSGIEIMDIKQNDTSHYFFIGQSFMKHLSSSSRHAYFDLIRDINTKGSGFSYPMTFENGEEVDSFDVTGYMINDAMVFVMMSENAEYQTIIHEIISLNSRLVTEIRELRKNKNTTEDEGIFLEVSRLNNELLNSKRIIEKQNAELRKLNEKLHEMTLVDPLTQAYNRRYFYQLCDEKAHHVANNFPICLVMIDFNYFKEVNDTLGHDAGDKLLSHFVQIAKSELKPHGGLVFRMGGDEFVFLIRKIDKDATQDIVESISNQFAQYTTIASIAYGIVCVSAIEDLIDVKVENFLQAADKLMYEAKQHMKNLR